MFKGNIKMGLYTFVVCLFLAMGTSVTYATITNSNYGYYGPINGYSYENQATAVANTSAYAYTWVSTTGDDQVPAGYMAAQAKVYNSSGVLKKSSDLVYNDDPCIGYNTVTPNTIWSGTYYSKGLTKAYNGNGYDTYYTFTSPNVTL